MIADAPKPAEPAVSEPTPSAAAIRAKKWRKQQKQNNPDFEKKEAERKASERAETRAETERIEQIEKIVKANPNPLFVMKDAPHAKGKLETGGGVAENQPIGEDGNRIETGRGGPTGHAPDGDGKPLTGSALFGIAPNKETQEFDDTFVEEAFKRFKSPKEVRALHRFVYEVTSKVKPEPTKFRVGALSRVCLYCKWVIPATGPEIHEIVFRHFWREHPDAFQILLNRLNDKGCLEDHAGMVQRHGGGPRKVQCGKCRKILWKPPRKSVRTDRKGVQIGRDIALSR